MTKLEEAERKAREDAEEKHLKEFLNHYNYKEFMERYERECEPPHTLVGFFAWIKKLEKEAN